MKYPIVISLIVSVVFCSCNQNKPKDKIEVVESVDSTSIASDTATEMAIEGSYEYAKSVTVSKKLVYDVIAYGGPASYGEYAILRRGSDNKADTVFHGQRFGIVANAFTADLDSNGQEEIYIVMRKAGAKGNSHVTAIEFDRNGAGTPLVFRDSARDNMGYTPEQLKETEALPDTFYTEGRELIRALDYHKRPHPSRVYFLKDKGFIRATAHCGNGSINKSILTK